MGQNIGRRLYHHSLKPLTQQTHSECQTSHEAYPSNILSPITLTANYLAKEISANLSQMILLLSQLSRPCPASNPNTMFPVLISKSRRAGLELSKKIE
jgi:hypothetical protein